MTSPEFPVAWLPALAGALLVPSTIAFAIRFFKGLT